MKKLTEAIEAGLGALSNLPKAGTAAALLAVMSNAANATTIGTPTDFDSTFGTSYTPSGGVDCLGGLQPHNLTGGLGVRSDVCEDKVETTSDGNTFTDIKSDILSAISSAGFSVDGTVIGTCDYSDNFDELMVIDVLNAKGFVIEGLSTGTITGVKELQGTSESCGSIDETYGTYHMPADTRGYVEIHEFTETSSPTPVYAYGTDEISNASVSLGTDMAVFNNVDDGYSANLVENMSSGSSATVTPFGVSGAVFGLFEAHETGGDMTALLKDSSTLQYVEITGTTVTDPDEDGDGEAASVDCDDTDPAINSSATEVCDGVDNDCDGTADVGAADASRWYVDADGDGVGGTDSTLACEATGVYVEETTGDYDDNDASVQTEPVAEECDAESPDGTYTPGETVCTPEGVWDVGGGSSAYEASSDIIELDEQGDWGAWVDAVTADTMSYSERWVLVTDVGSSGRTGLGVSVDAMLTGSNMAPPPSEEGSEYYLSIDIDGGTATLMDMVEGIDYPLEEGSHTVEVESEGDTGVDTGDTGGDDTGPDDTGPVDTDDTAEVDDTDTDSGTPDTPDDDTDGNGETPKDGDQGGCNSCASTPMPDGSLAVFGLALAGTLMRRRKQ